MYGKNYIKYEKSHLCGYTIETGIYSGLLNYNGIPSYAVYRECGGFLNLYMGFTVYGVDIYVNEMDYEKAVSILSDLSFTDGEYYSLPEKEDHWWEEKSFNSNLLEMKRQKTAKIIATLFLLPFLMLELFNLIELFLLPFSISMIIVQ